YSRRIVIGYSRTDLSSDRGFQDYVVLLVKVKSYSGETTVIITLLEKLSGRRNFWVLAVLAEKTLSQRWHRHLKNLISFDDVTMSKIRNLILEGFYIVSLSSTSWNS
ncbi:hypothetical protein AVEN_105530-1, partial [Araneus ventricosus]